MSAFGGFVLTVAGLLALEAALCLLAPLLRSNLAWSRAMQTNEQVRSRGMLMLAAATGALWFAWWAL